MTIELRLICCYQQSEDTGSSHILTSRGFRRFAILATIFFFRSVLVGIFWYVAAEIAIQLLDAYNPKITEFWDGRFSEPFTSPGGPEHCPRRFLSLRAQLILFLDARCQESGQ